MTATKGDVMEAYRKWSSYPELTQAMREDLSAIANDEAAIYDRFYRDLEFGTGGLRGILGAGTNRMNIYTVRRASIGFARHILHATENGGNRSIVVGYDCRRMSREFAVEVGLVMAKQGIHAYVFEHLCPTPELSFAVRELHAAAGVMITASHNPREYNGYKVYRKDGCQLLPDEAKQVLAEIEQVTDLFSIPVLDKFSALQQGLLEFVGPELDNAYCARVLQEIQVPSLTPEERASLKVVYTPLHGTGNLPVRRVLSMAGYRDVRVVPSQERPDGEFPTVKSPNPEESAAFAEALQLAHSIEADIALATDPDADRVGVAVRKSTGDYQLLTGNQVGGLLVDYVLDKRIANHTLPQNGVVLKTIVTSEFGAEIARKHGVSVENTLTGFKYIGDRILHYEQTHAHQFLLGYEESYGYLAAPFVRDKDAVQICLLVSEMAAEYHKRGQTLLDRLDSLYQEVGYFEEALVSKTMQGEDGTAKIQKMMATLHRDGLPVKELPLVAVEDYQALQRTEYADSADKASSTKTERLDLPQSNVLKYCYAGGSWLAVRPSGTEPKIKFYLGAKGNSKDICDKIMTQLKAAVDGFINLSK